MRIGLIIQNYRKRNKMSMDAFAKKCGLSKAYVGLLEQGTHPKTKKPIHPSVDTINRVAIGLGIDFDSLFRSLDEDVTLSNDIITDADEQEMLKLFQTASEEMRKAALAVLKAGQQPVGNEDRHSDTTQ